MTTEYFSDREFGPRPQTDDEIAMRAWGGIVALVQNLIATGALGHGFPARCSEGGVCGTDQRTLGLTIQAELGYRPTAAPRAAEDVADKLTFDHSELRHCLSWPLDEHDLPVTHVVCDLIEFCYQHLGKPVEQDRCFFGHCHLTFDVESGHREFREAVNRIFARNGVALELQVSGEVHRIAPPVLRETLAATVFETEDAHLNRLLELARSRFQDPDPGVRRESLEKLWDAWERLKTVEPGADKSASASAMLSKAAPEAEFRSRLETEAKELTDIGNKFQIRHAETWTTPVKSPLQVDYLFHRLFALVWLCLRSSGRAT